MRDCQRICAINLPWNVSLWDQVEGSFLFSSKGIGSFRHACLLARHILSFQHSCSWMEENCHALNTFKHLWFIFPAISYFLKPFLNTSFSKNNFSMIFLFLFHLFLLPFLLRRARGPYNPGFAQSDGLAQSGPCTIRARI